MTMDATKNKIPVYIIWDTRENKQWEGNRSNKCFWYKPGHAKSALMQGHTDASNYTKDELIRVRERNREYHQTDAIDKFDDQTRFQCWKCDVVPIEEV